MKKLDLAKLDQFKKPAEQPPQPEFDPDLVPEDPYKDSEPRVNLKDHVDILEAYEKYGSPLRDGFRPSFRANQRENIMVRCPIPGHVDLNPDAWITLDKNTICCGPCGNEGLDLYDLAAIYYDYPFPQYKAKGNEEQFKEVAARIADDFGITITRTASLTRSVEPFVVVPGLEGSGVINAEQPKTAGQSQGPSSEPEVEPTVLAFPGSDDPDEDESAYLKLIPPCNWRDLVPPDTFMYQYMQHYEPEKLPLWYGFWSAMALCGLATGRDAYLDMDSKPVYPNLFLAFFGASGFGKSRSLSHLSELIRLALPYYADDVHCLGVKKLIEPNSDVRLIEMFQAVEKDSKGGIIAEYPIRGYLEFDELASLIGKSNRTGNPMKPVLHSLYDCAPDIATSSRTHGDIRSVLPFCTTIVGTQPRAIRSLFMDSDVDSGFASRWLYIIAHPIPPADRKLFAPYPDMSSLIEPLKKIHEWAKLMPRKMNLTTEALKTLEEFVRDEVWTISPNKHPMFTKIELSVKKMLTCMAINKFETEISNDTVLDMIRLFPHPKQSYLFLEGDLATSERSEFYTHIEGLISRFEGRAGRAPTYNEIWSRVNPKHKDARLVRSALEDLAFLGVLDKKERVNSRGPKSLTFGTTKSEARQRR